MMSARQMIGAVGVTLGLGSAAAVTTQLSQQQAAYDVSTTEGRSRLLEQLERDLDPGSLNWASTPPPDGHFIAGDIASYMVYGDGRVQEHDPASFAVRTKLDLGGVPGIPTVLAGRLIVPMTNGHVKVVAGGEVVIDKAVGSPGDDLAVSRMREDVVLMNRSAGELRRLNVRSGELSDVLRPELPRGELLVPPQLPGDQLWMFSERSGHLVGVNLDSGEVQARKVADHGHDFLTPVVTEERVYLVDRSGGGSILEVDPVDSERPVVHTALELTDTSQVDLVAQEGKVYVNDWGSNRAVIITDGEYRVIDKEADEELAKELPGQTGGPPAGAPSAPPSTDQPVDCSGEWVDC